MGIKSFFTRWQEATLLLPLLLLLSLGAWVVLGALDRTVGQDVLFTLANLPVLTMYAMAPAWLTYQVRKRWRRKLTDEEQKTLWDSAVAGKPGALIVYIVDAGVTLCVLALLLAFFSRSL